MVDSECEGHYSSVDLHNKKFKTKSHMKVENASSKKYRKNNGKGIKRTTQLTDNNNIMKGK